jgi:hypothetical protein
MHVLVLVWPIFSEQSLHAPGSVTRSSREDSVSALLPVNSTQDILELSKKLDRCAPAAAGAW